MESLSSFEMLHRGVDAARDSVARHRRTTLLSHRLSGFLADASLADAPESLVEILRLTVDQACEVVAADGCLATVAAGGSPRAAQAIAHRGPDRDWAWTRWLDLPSVYRLLDERGGSFLRRGRDATELLGALTSRPLPAVDGWLAASLTALDGTRLGALQAFGTGRAGFTEEDEAALIHLAQMLSGAAERMRLYHRGEGG